MDRDAQDAGSTPAATPAEPYEPAVPDVPAPLHALPGQPPEMILTGPAEGAVSTALVPIEPKSHLAIVEPAPAAALTWPQRVTRILAELARDGKTPVTIYLDTLTTPKSRQSMGEALRRALRGLGEPDAGWRTAFWWQLTYADIVQMRRGFEYAGKDGAPLSPQTVKQAFAAVKGVLAVSFNLGLMRADHYMRVTSRWPKIRGESISKGRALEDAEVTVLHAWCAAQPTFYGAMLWGIFAVMLGGGLRREEVTKLEVGDLSDDARTLLVHGKGGKVKKVRLPQGAGGALEAWLAQRDRFPFQCEAMFPLVLKGEAHDQMMTVKRLWLLLREASQKTGIAFTPHDLRRTYITDNIKKHGLAKASKLARHADVRTTMLYDRTEADELAAASVSLERWFS